MQMHIYLKTILDERSERLDAVCPPNLVAGAYARVVFDRRFDDADLPLAQLGW